MMFQTDRRVFLLGTSAALSTGAWPAWAAASETIEPQPFFASVDRAVEALAKAGQPIASADAEELARLALRSDAGAVRAADALLNRYVIARLAFSDGGAGTVDFGGADRTLIEQGWKSFLVRIVNPSQAVGDVEAASGGVIFRGNGEQRAAGAEFGAWQDAQRIDRAWLHYEFAESQPLSGATVEYRVIDMFARNSGHKAAKLWFSAKNPNSDFWSPSAEFNCLPARSVALSILDSDGVGCMASLVIKDAQGHVYPPQVRRIAPDMAFHPQIYRADGENVLLADGEYTVSSGRGPEYIRQSLAFRVCGDAQKISVRLKRWIDPARWGWYSGDTHIHNAGCSHYIYPTEGVSPETMIRHVRGEGLSVGSALNWAPSWYYQKRFFSGHTVSPEATLEYPELQRASNQKLTPARTPKDRESILRYDVEVSGFPSSMSGHVILLQLKHQDYPGTKSIEDWPSYTLPIMKWAKSEGGLVGFAHCSLGMRTSSSAIPNYEIPPFDSFGTNEAIVDVTHDACDFLSGCQGQPASELNSWYHMLNCGLRLAMVGETDFPCLYDDQVGMGRSYVQLEERPTDDAGYAAWLGGIRSGRLYFGDGRTHFLKFAVNGRRQGSAGLELSAGGAVTVEALVAARLEPEALRDIRTTHNSHPEWHIEFARIGETRTVPLELVVNGYPVERIEFLADGQARPVEFKTRIERSSWVALRILPSGHTHPMFVSVRGKPIRASRRSAEWLRKCVDALWQEKQRLIRDSERSAASDAYNHARLTYEQIIHESDVA